MSSLSTRIAHADPLLLAGVVVLAGVAWCWRPAARAAAYPLGAEDLQSMPGSAEPDWAGAGAPGLGPHHGHCAPVPVVGRMHPYPADPAGIIGALIQPDYSDETQLTEGY